MVPHGVAAGAPHMTLDNPKSASLTTPISLAPTPAIETASSSSPGRVDLDSSPGVEELG